MKKRLLSLLLVFTLMLGFIPTVVTADPGDLNLGVTYYDFNVPLNSPGPNPDFESGNMGNDIGSIAPSLLTNGAYKYPVLKSGLTKSANGTIHSVDSFSEWYRPVASTNMEVGGNLLMSYNSGTGFYNFSDSTFFPLSNNGSTILGYGNQGREQNYHFTMKMHTTFTYDADKTSFTFEGDDDVFVFIDGKLVLDIGGVHSPLLGTFDLASNVSTVAGITTAMPSLGLVNGQTYDFDLFFAERHTVLSNLRITTNLPLKPINNLTTAIRDTSGNPITTNAPTILPAPGSVTPYLSTNSATISANNNNFYRFVRWDLTVPGSTIPETRTDASTTIPMTSPILATAVYAPILLQVNAVTVPASIGAVSPSSVTGKVNDVMTFTAPVAPAGYRFDGWYTDYSAPSLASQVAIETSEAAQTAALTVKPLFANAGYTTVPVVTLSAIYVQIPVIEVTKTVSPSPAYVNETVNFVITVRNAGTLPIAGVSFKDLMVDGEKEFPGIDWNAKLLPSQSASYSYTKSFANKGDYTNVVTVSAIGANERTTTASAKVDFTVSTRPVNSPPPTSNPSNNTLTIALEGQGTLVPGAGSHVYSTGSLVQMQAPVPAAGWVFSGWFGANGSEVSANTIQMNGNKNIIARFVSETVPLAPSELPQAAPEVTPAPEKETGITVIDTPEVVPQAAPVLPKTGGLPMGLMLSLGGLLSAGGLFLKKRR